MNSPAQSVRLERLLGFLERDPANLPLLADAAGAAFDDRAFDLSAELIDRYGRISAPPVALRNLAGLVALARRDFAGAETQFAALMADGHDEPPVRFNLAWARAMQDDHEGALALLDEQVAAVSHRAAALKVQMLHHLGRFEEALACGRDLAERFPDNQPLMGALATVAMDADEAELAIHYAQRAGDNAEGLAVQGMFVLNDGDPAASLAMFDRALALSPANPRAWVGKGLGLLAAGDPLAGAEAIDRGAEMFGDHLGSWIASGWAHFAGGDLGAARARFEHALALDPNFAESHGGLAVLALLDGRVEEARRHSDIALRLDRQSLGGALSKSMLLEQGGDPQAAERIRALALSTPVGPRGETIAQALSQFSSGLRPS